MLYRGVSYFLPPTSGITVDGNDLETCLASLMQIRTYPRVKQGVEVIDISSMATSALLDMERNACYDSGSATGITTDVRDMAYIDTSVEARDSHQHLDHLVGRQSRFQLLSVRWRWKP